MFQGMDYLYASDKQFAWSRQRFYRIKLNNLFEERTPIPTRLFEVMGEDGNKTVATIQKKKVKKSYNAKIEI